MEIRYVGFWVERKTRESGVEKSLYKQKQLTWCMCRPLLSSWIACVQTPPPPALKKNRRRGSWGEGWSVHRLLLDYGPLAPCQQEPLDFGLLQRDSAWIEEDLVEQATSKDWCDTDRASISRPHSRRQKEPLLAGWASGNKNACLQWERVGFMAQSIPGVPFLLLPPPPCQFSGSCHFVLQMPHGEAGRSYKTAADPGEGPGAPDPPSDLTLVWDWNSYINRIVYHFLTGWFFFNKTRFAFCHKTKFQGYSKM